MERLRRLEAPIDKYLHLRDLQQADPAAFFRLLCANTEEVLPFVYTPTVGEACQRYSHLPLRTTGLFISLRDKGRVLAKLRGWPHAGRAKVCVVTDGERILGLGDLGAGGMGIAEGKILLYTAAAGVHPDLCLPVCLDVGTNNESLLRDPQYKGLRQRRATGAEYAAFLDEFMGAVREVMPDGILQFEDFANHNAFDLLRKYRGVQCCFNDDIQGTASITLAGVMSALRLKRQRLSEQTFMFLGAGEAGTGIGELVALAMAYWVSRLSHPSLSPPSLPCIRSLCGSHLPRAPQEGLDVAEARRKCIFLDSKGVVCRSRPGRLQPHKVNFAHDIPHHSDLLAAVRAFKPTVLIGVSTIAKAFSRPVLDAMLEYTERPVVFPLSNPTSKSECTYEEAFAWTGGKVIFASGSPFAPIERGGAVYSPAQANNAYIFPALGHAAILAGAKSIPDELFLDAAECLAKQSELREIERGFLFPPFSRILDVSVKIMTRLGESMQKKGLLSGPVPPGLDGWEGVVSRSLFIPAAAGGGGAEKDVPGGTSRL